MTTRRWVTRTGNRFGVWLYRTLEGRLFGGRSDVGVLLLTAPGRRTGVPRSACVAYLDTDEGMLVWGSGAGAPSDPDWFRNVRGAERVEVQVRDRRFTARPRVLEGEERERAWREVVLARAPHVNRYAEKAGRTIPLACLVPERRG